MSPMRAIVALLVVAAAAAAFYLIADSGSEGEGNPAVTEARAESRDGIDAGGSRPELTPVTSDELAEAAATPLRSEAAGEGLAATTEKTAKAESGPRFVISGRVVDDAGQPVADADVSLSPDYGFVIIDSDHGLPQLQSGKTGADGRFRFEAVSAKSALRVRAEPKRLVPAEVQVPGERSGDLDVGDLVAALGGSLTGRVVTEAGQPVPGAKVRAWTQEEPKSGSAGVIAFGDPGIANARRAVADDAGFFRIDGLKAGEAVALAEKDGFTRESLKGIVIEKGRATEAITITLSKGAAISGVVVDTAGRALAGAHVSLLETVIDLSDTGFTGEFGKNIEVRSDANGAFRLDGLKQSNYEVSAAHDGHVTTRARAVAAGTSDLRLVLEKSGLLLAYVRDGSTGRPVEQFEVRVSDHGPYGFAMARDRASRVLRGEEAAALAGVAADPGLFVLPDLASEKVSVDVLAEGFAEARRSAIEVPGGGRTEIEFRLTPEITVSGVVLDPDGLPVSQAEVALDEVDEQELPFGSGGFRRQRRIEIEDDGDGPDFIESPGRALTARSGDDGTFTIRGAVAGSYKLAASHAEWAPSEAVPLTLADGERAADFELILRAGGALTGVTYDADGRVLPGALVTLKNPPPKGPAGGVRISGGSGVVPAGFGGDSVRQATSDSAGRYAMGGILPGQYLAELSRAGGGPVGSFMFMAMDEPGGAKGVPVTIEEGTTATLDLTLPPTGAVAGRVTETGAPLEGVALALKKADQMFDMGGPRARTDENGTFLMEEVEPGDYTLTITPPQAAQPIERKVKVRARETARETIALPTGSIAGSVTDVDSGDPVAGVIVEVRPARREGAAPAPARRQTMAIMVRADDGAGAGITSMTFGDDEQTIVTAEDGSYLVRYLEPGDYRVEVRGSGIQKDRKERVRVQEGLRTENVDFDAVRGATLVIRPTSDSNEPMHFFQASVTLEPGGETESRTEVGNPVLEFDGLAPGTYRVEVTSGNRSGAATATISSGERKEVPVALD